MDPVGKNRESWERALLDQILSEVNSSSVGESVAYLCGAMHDGTRSSRHRTIRIAQSSRGWRIVLQAVLSRIGSRSWAYREGDRAIYVVEAVDRLPKEPELTTTGCIRAYARGYFDAEGGYPVPPNARPYIQFTQKDHADLSHVRRCLIDLGIECGRMHNPSVRVDPNYWRFYVASASHDRFIDLVAPWHPRKRARMLARSTLVAERT